MKLYNTLTREIETFTPHDGNNVKMYTCGLTVYSQPQIGNWVAYIYSDVLTRTLQASGFDVMRIQNITDVGHLVSDDDAGEDKMEKGAKQEGLTAWEVADKYIAIADREAYELLGLQQPTKLVRATDLIQEQINFVKKLEAKGYAYVTEDGVYFDTSKLDDYGKLAKLDIKGLEAGARVDVRGKKNKTDFALWKFSLVGQKRDMEWESPWGTGFPGWHLECSVIAYENLGEQIDLHTGGIDHIPVHHTNEIAQTESVTGKQFSKYWFHNNHIKVNGTKLSKSLGNSYTLQDIQDKGYSLEAFKLLVLSSHYRTEGNFSWEILEAAQNRVNHWGEMFNRCWQADVLTDSETDISAHILEALQNDLDTPKVLALIDEYFDKVNANGAMPNRETLLGIRDLLGIDLFEGDINDDQKALLVKRQTARNNKDWQISDTLRDALAEQGIGIHDTNKGQVWYRTT